MFMVLIWCLQILGSIGLHVLTNKHNSYHTTGHSTRDQSLGWSVLQWMKYSFNLVLFLSLYVGQDWLSLDWCHHGAATTGRLDPPPGQTRCGLLPDPRGPLALLGGRHESETSGEDGKHSIKLLCRLKLQLMITSGSLSWHNCYMLPLHQWNLINFSQLSIDWYSQV